jgi:hypothetical protein
MKLYDGIIENIRQILSAYPVKELPVESPGWRMVTDRSMILRADMAYELGSGKYAGIGATILTGERELVPEDGIFLIGPDLPQIHGDADYARIALVRVREEGMGEGNSLYNAIRKLEYTRYHFYPEGFMMRVSSSQQRESVRIARGALHKGLNFSATGNRMIEAFRRNEMVEAVQICYVTDPDFPYGELEKLVQKAEAVTKTIDHILKDVKMDCNVCNLQEICNEVEGLRELHFAK